MAPVITRSRWFKLRDATGADSSGTLTTSNADWDNRPTSRLWYIPQSMSGLYLALIGHHASDPNNGTATVKVWFYRDKGPAEYGGTFVFTIGQQAVVRYPFSPYATTATAKYADTIAITDQRWAQTFTVVNGTLGNDQFAYLKVHSDGATAIVVEVTGVSAGLTVTPIITGRDIE